MEDTLHPGLPGKRGLVLQHPCSHGASRPPWLPLRGPELQDSVRLPGGLLHCQTELDLSLRLSHPGPPSHSLGRPGIGP